jgi:mono/diheme cytochrome c family protein
MQSPWSVRYASALLMLALGGCPDQLDDLGPDGDIEPGKDAGRVVEPVETKEDATAAKHDATVANDAAAVKHEDASVIDAGAPDANDASSADASSDASSDSDGGNEPNGSFASVYEIISVNCLGCHGAAKTLDLSTPELALAGLVGVEAKYPACVSDGGVTPVRVVAGDPAASLLIAKLEGTQSCGKQMPPKALLEADKIAVFRAWVAAGAQ